MGHLQKEQVLGFSWICPNAVAKELISTINFANFQKSKMPRAFAKVAESETKTLNCSAIAFTPVKRGV